MTSNLFIGTDIVSVKRIKQLLDKHRDRFKKKIFSPQEIAYCDEKSDPAIHFAGRFVAKEAIKKCFLSSELVIQMGFNEIEILPSPNGAPIVSKIYEYNYSDLKVSISHEFEYAIGMAILTI